MLYNNPLALCGGWEGGIEFSWHLWTSVFCFWNISHCAELGFIWRFESAGLTGLILTYYVCKILLLKAANKRPQWVGSKQQDLKMLVILLVLVIQRMCLFTTRLTVCSWTRFTRNAVRGAVEMMWYFKFLTCFHDLVKQWPQECHGGDNDQCLCLPARVVWSGSWTLVLPFLTSGMGHSEPPGVPPRTSWSCGVSGGAHQSNIQQGVEF